METPGHTPESDQRPRLRACRRRGALRRADRRRAVHRRRRPAGPARLDRPHRRRAGPHAPRLGPRLLALPDEVRVFPAHGAGSACGKNLSTERWSTIGDQRSDNYACAPMSEDEFVALVTAGQPAAPDYFVFDAVLNRKVHDVFDPSRHARPLDLPEVLHLQQAGAVVVDARDAAGVRRRPPRGRPERAGRRPVRRDRGQRRAAGPADRRGRPAGPRGGGRRPARPDRLRPRGGLPARARGRLPRRSRARPPGQPADRPGAGDGTAAARGPRSWSTCATRARCGSARFPGPCPCRSPSCPGGWPRSRGTGRSSRTAPAATAPASRPPCCAAQASTTCPTSWAATAPGCRSPSPSS